MIAETAPELSVRRLQRGSRGGDQQLGALIATGDLDAVIFFADPTVPHGGDVDLQALTRLAIVHDTPIALSGTAADMLAAALLRPAGLTKSSDPGKGGGPARPRLIAIRRHFACASGSGDLPQNFHPAAIRASAVSATP